MSSSDTIFAPATAPGRAGIAVFRVSGPNAAKVFDLCVPKTIPKPRYASRRRIHKPHTGEIIDHALVLYFNAPHSFTGEEVVEIHVHGGHAVSQALTECLTGLAEFRMAEPGEFTRRAFEHGKMDLTAAEAVADLIHAETEAQRRQAMRQMDGALGKLYEDWRSRLARSLAYLEAAIDFADEDLPQEIAVKQEAALRDLSDALAQHLDDRHLGERMREGFSIAIVGPPNAGKSSLLNKLAQRDAAIVSSTAGTTRDVIEVHLDLGGYPVTLADTAGLRERADGIESEGIRRALARAEQADLKLVVFDGAAWPQRDDTTQKLVDGNTIAVVNKLDLLQDQATRGESKIHTPPPLDVVFVSAHTGEGFDALLDRLIHEIDLRFADRGQPPLTRARHRAGLEECKAHLDRALGAQQSELRAEDVRLAMRALGRITGRVDVEDLLDIIFRDFCIGK
jgi:tRNA modification GTPase